jgi:HSP20 family protein
MANVAVHKGNGDRPASALVREWEPFRAFRDLLRWDPFAEMAPAGWSGELAAFAPDFDVKETKDGFVFKADLPGVKEADLEVRLTQNRLTISGKRESERTDKGETFYTYERSSGSFSRAFTLPAGVDADKIKAELKNGVLTVELPKPPELQPKKIAVKSV